MIVFYTTLTIIIAIFGETNFFLRLNAYVLPFFLVLLSFILIELVRFYRNARKYTLFPEKNPLLKMKYWHYPDLKEEKRRRLLKIVGSFIFISLLVLVIVVEILFVREILRVLITIFIVVSQIFFWLNFILLFITSFIAAKGTMQKFEARYSEKFRQQSYWFFLFLPLPWILFFIILFTTGEIIAASSLLGVELIRWYFGAQILYSFLCLIGIITILKKNWRVGYTASQVSASLTFLTVIVIPGIIELAQDELVFILSLIGLVQLDTSGGSSYYFLGPIISLLAMGFFFIQGALDGYGDKLREYYAAWDEKLHKFNIKSEEDIKNQTYDKVFDETPLAADNPNAYRNLLFGLILLLLTFFGIIHGIGGIFSVLGVAYGAEQLSLFLPTSSYIEFWGLTIGLFIFTLIIVFRKQIEQ